MRESVWLKFGFFWMNFHRGAYTASFEHIFSSSSFAWSLTSIMRSSSHFFREIIFSRIFFSWKWYFISSFCVHQTSLQEVTSCIFVVVFFFSIFFQVERCSRWVNNNKWILFVFFRVGFFHRLFLDIFVLPTRLRESKAKKIPFLIKLFFLPDISR